MAEYLAPGVYVEEVDTGSKPIEGVSTSTSGLVGMTERGPVNVPTLVTSVGDYFRKFGGRLDFETFTVGQRCHAYLPYAIEGYFKNLGKRAYVTRVVPENAANAVRNLYDRGQAGGADTVLLTGASENTGTAANLPLLRVADASAIAQNDVIRIGDGSRAEYRTVASNPVTVAATANEAILLLDVGLYRDATQGSVVRSVDMSDVNANLLVAGGTHTTTDIGVDNVAGLVAGVQVTINGEMVTINTVDSVASRITVAPPLSGVPSDNDAVTIARLVAGGGHTTTDVGLNDIAGVEVGIEVTINGETVTVTAVDTVGSRITVAPALTLPPADSDAVTVNRVVSGDHTTTVFGLDSVADLAVGLQLTLNGDTVTITAIDTVSSSVTVAPPLSAPPVDNDAVTILFAKALSGTVTAGSVVVPVNNRIGLDAGDIVRIGIAPDEEYVEIEAVLGDRVVSPDAGSLLLAAPLRQDHANGAELCQQSVPVANAVRPDATLIFNAAEDSDRLYASSADQYQMDDIVSITLPNNAVYYHRLEGNAVALNSMGDIEINRVLDYNHDIGEPVVERDALFEVVALDPGAWGNRLRVSVQDEDRGLLTTADVEMPLNPGTRNQLRLNTLTGVESGTILELFDPTTGEAVGGLLKVASVDRSANNLVTLDGNMIDNTQIAAAALGARSREFRITAHLLRQPDPAVPSRDDSVIDSESFMQLSMDPRHGRYFERIIGTTWNVVNDVDDNGDPLRRYDRRSEGESAYIRARDLAVNTAEERSVRLGPEALVDILPNGLPRAARHPLRGGDDALATIAADVLADAMYIGEPAVDPEDRSGLYSLQNIEQISLVAIPGQITTDVQQALIDQCEALRYRFAVLDGPAPNNDTLADVQAQRQQFDSKYAALYHPWMTISDPMPANLANIQQVALPPSGHILGIYARTDIERGVHKAPANETVRGILGLSRLLNKAEHDILNPYPVNINVIRDFRRDNRGIRVWGARCITSDPDYKYVNVRRLMIFIEHSIDRGLQWVVFEPNAEPLWARVRRSIANFLTVVWRNGALEGTSPEQAFFVKCDRETMTQTDIDNGRLICQIGIAPVKPAEFVIIRIGLWTANADEN